MDEPLQIRDDVVIPAAELLETASRSSGPGGQHVNTTNSRVTLHWHIAETVALSPYQKNRVMTVLKNRISADGVLQISVESERSQHANRLIARARMADIVRKALIRPKKRIPTKTPRSVHRRRLDNKCKRGQLKRLRSRPRSDD